MVPHTRRMIGGEAVTVLTATGFEGSAARKELPADVPVVQAGIALSRLRSRTFRTPVIVCGLAGGTTRYAPAGTLLVPREVCGPTGERLVCDGRLVEALAASARQLGLTPTTEPMYTSATVVRGPRRAELAQLGFASVDMEAALIEAPRLAVVRVILDTPQRELSEAWVSPLRVLLSPSAWREIPWLAREGGRFARLAARVIAGALQMKV